MRNIRVKAAVAGACAALCALTASGLAEAYQVSPMIYDLTPSGAGATATVRVQNDDEKPITIELTAERRDFDENGKESRTPADADFVLFPPQAVVPAGKTQAVRVQYVGKAALTQSVMYVITIKQVPVELPKSGPSGVQFVFNFGTLANVVPTGAKADVQVKAITPAAGGGYQLRLHNAGNKYANISLGGLVLNGGGKSTQLSGSEWRKTLGTSWLLPGKDRVITVPQVSGMSGPVTAKYDASLPSDKA
jgi:fimbrial chaperone protein